MTESKLADVLHSVAKRVRADFETSTAVLHRGAAGATRESIVRDFVAAYLPGHVEAVHGAEIVTATGQVSPQCDVVIYDGAVPPLLDGEGHRVLFNEGVYGVIEVKTDLDKPQLHDACEKIRKVKALPKTAYDPAPFHPARSVYGKGFNYFPTAGMIFAFDGIDIAALGSHMMNWCAEREVPPEERPDSVWVLGKGFLVWTNPLNGKVDISPEPGAGLIALKPPTGRDVLFPLVLMLSSHFTTARMPPLRLMAYGGDSVWGTVAEVFQENSASNIGTLNAEAAKAGGGNGE